MTVVQEITLWWTKKSRSAPGSAVRNAVPELFDLPLRPTTRSTAGVLHHAVLIEEWSGFDHRTEAVEDLGVPADQPLRLGCIRVTPGPEVVEVVYAYDFGCGGVPERTGHPRRVLRLQRGQWGRVVYNGRFEDWRTGEWLYKKVVANVAQVHGGGEGVFSGGPTRAFHDLAVLR